MPNKSTEESYESYRREYEKLMLSKRYDECNDYLSEATSRPSIQNIIDLHGSIVGFLTAIPIVKDEDETARTKWFEELDEVEIILFGHPSRKRRELMRKYRVNEALTTAYNSFEAMSLVNVNNITRALRKILMDSGRFTAKLGLRLTLKQTKKIGFEYNLEMENLDDFDPYTEGDVGR